MRRAKKQDVCDERRLPHDAHRLIDDLVRLAEERLKARLRIGIAALRPRSRNQHLKSTRTRRRCHGMAADASGRAGQPRLSCHGVRFDVSGPS